MPRTEILSPEGYRADGRRWNERRTFRARTDLPTCRQHSDGSSLVCTGLTTVMCTVSGPKEANANLRGQINNERAFLNVNYLIAPFAGQERKKIGRNDKRVQEIQLSIERTFREAVLVKLYPRSQIDISITVLEQDGGVLAAAINATTLALIDAGIPMYTLVTAVTAGVELSQLPGRCIVDLTASEESDISFVTVGTDGTGEGDKINYLQCETKMSMDNFDSTLRLAITGAKEVKAELEEVCRQAGAEYKASMDR